MQHPFRFIATFCATTLGTTCTQGAWTDDSDARRFEYRATTLDNGMRVVTLEDHSCPIVAVHLWYHVGSKDENPERQGFAHMFEHMMFRGTDRLGPTDHFELIRGTGGTCNAYTAFDQTVYVQTLPSNQLELVLWLEAERMAFLKIDQDSFDTERKVVEEERRLGLNAPYGTALEKVLPQLFGDHPYRWSPIGKIPHLRSASVRELRDFWKRFYVPNNATLIIAGDVTHERAQLLADKYFGWIPRYDEPPRVAPPREDWPAGKVFTLKEDNAPVPGVGIGFRTVPAGHPDGEVLEMLATIVGQGDSSRLHRELVAEKQLAVMAMAFNMSLEQVGLIGAGAVLAPIGSKPDVVLGVIRANFERLRSEPVSEHELIKARNQLLRDTVTNLLSVESKARQLGTSAVLEGDLERVNRRVERIKAITADELQRVARKYLAADQAVAIKAEQNILGALLRKRNPEEDAPITAQPETTPPPPGRQGLKRPEGFAQSPPVAPAVPYNPAYPHEERTLANGLRIIVVPNHEVPIVEVMLGFKFGSWTERRIGSASAALSLLTKGSSKHTEAELADELDTYAITMGGAASQDDAEMSASCLTEHLPRAMELLAEVTVSPAFAAEEFEKHRKQVKTKLAISSAEASYVAERELRRRLFGQHPYAHTATGEVEDLDALALNDVKEWWNTYARPDVATLLISGDVDPQPVFALAERVFGRWSVPGPKPEVQLANPPEITETQIYLVDRPGVQSQIRVAQSGPARNDPRYASSWVVSDYFGGGFSSRLNDLIRVKKGLTYGAGGGFSAARFLGSFRASTFSKTESTVEAVKAVLSEVKRLKSEPPSESELARTKSSILGSYIREHESPEAVAAELWLIDRDSLPPDHFATLLTQVAEMKREDCMQVIEQFLEPNKLIIVVVGDATSLREDLKSIAPVTVIEKSSKQAPERP